MLEEMQTIFERVLDCGVVYSFEMLYPYGVMMRMRMPEDTLDKFISMKHFNRIKSGSVADSFVMTSMSYDSGEFSFVLHGDNDVATAVAEDAMSNSSFRASDKITEAVLDKMFETAVLSDLDVVC